MGNVREKFRTFGGRLTSRSINQSLRITTSVGE